MIDKITGGCQCGAVRYAVHGQLNNPHICHCRMCQKAAGNYFMPLAQVLKSEFKTTRGEFSWFFSSDPVRRGFCKDCGTPLTLESIGSPNIYITLGSLDEPAAVEPKSVFGVEGRMPWLSDICTAGGAMTEDDEDQDGASLSEIASSNHQHPDHDTETWPLKGADQ